MSPKKNTDVSIIIVNYNTREFIGKCLDSIYSSSGRFSYEVLVVDNASEDKSVDFLGEKYSQIILIANRKNLGFAKAVNQGIKKSAGRYILLLNPDTALGKNTLSEMIRIMDKNPGVGVSTCRVELSNGEIDWASHRGFPTPWRSFSYFSRINKLFPRSRVFGGYHLEHEDLNKPHEIDSPCGAFYLVRRQVIEKVGLLDEDYFIFAEDLDWSYRIKEAGYKIFYYPSVKVFHHKGASSGMHKLESKAKRQARKKAVESFYDTMKIFYNKHYQKKYPRLVKLFIFFGIDLLKNRRLQKLGLSSL